MTVLMPGMINIEPVPNPPKEPKPPPQIRPVGYGEPSIDDEPPAPRPSLRPPKPPPPYPEQGTHSTLSNFLASIRRSDGVALANRYDVVLVPPDVGRGGTTSKNPLFKSINDVSTDEIRETSMRCESLTLPGRNLVTFDDSTIYGPQRTVVSGAGFDDTVEMIFLASPDMRERVFFEKWQHAAFDQDTWNVSFYKDYIGTIEIYILNINEDRMYGVKLEECYPKTVAATQLSYSVTNEAVKLTVSMNFRYWKQIEVYPADAF